MLAQKLLKLVGKSLIRIKMMLYQYSESNFMFQPDISTYPTNNAKKSQGVQSDKNEISSTLLQRISNADKTAVESCINAYGNLVWAMAKKFTSSNADAENAVQEIFLEVWKFASHCDSSKTEESDFVKLVAYRYLLKRALNQSL